MKRKINIKYILKNNTRNIKRNFIRLTSKKKEIYNNFKL